MTLRFTQAGTDVGVALYFGESVLSFNSGHAGSGPVLTRSATARHTQISSGRRV